MSQTIMIRKYKIWRTGLNPNKAYYIWGKDSDEAFFKIARKLDPNVTSSQWTGDEKLVSLNEYNELIQSQLKEVA